MERRFDKKLLHLKGQVTTMFDTAVASLEASIDAVVNGAGERIAAVFEHENVINALELEIDNGVVDILALQQPVAIDLRLILAIQKINNDLERIGDHAINIAESARSLGPSPGRDPLLKIPQMSRDTLAMLKDARASFIELDAEKAQQVLERDDAIDTLNRELIAEVVQLIKRDQSTIEGNLQLTRVSRNLERVADLATNIAEEVIFYVKAKIVKHHAAE